MEKEVMFKDFDTSSFEKMKPPGNNTFDAMQEIKDLKKIPLNKKLQNFLTLATPYPLPNLCG